jgi:hypothetical protein
MPCDATPIGLPLKMAIQQGIRATYAVGNKAAE